MHSVEISVRDTAHTQDKAFESAATKFVEDLQAVENLDVVAPTKIVKGTRGLITLLSGIVAAGVKIGAFAAIYVLAKDLYNRYVNAEVQLKFKDGSTMTLSNLTQKEAEKSIAEHLKRAKGEVAE